MLRAPVFAGLREDKSPDEVVREEALTQESALEESSQENPAALDLSGREVIAEIDGHRLKFTNLDKIFFPKARLEKARSD